MPSYILTHFGKRLRQERLERGYSQEMLADRAKVHRTYIGMLERAEKNVTLESAQRIARALGLRVRDLIDF